MDLLKDRLNRLFSDPEVYWEPVFNGGTKVYGKVPKPAGSDDMSFLNKLKEFVFGTDKTPPQQPSTPVTPQTMPTVQVPLFSYEGSSKAMTPEQNLSVALGVDKIVQQYLDLAKNSLDRAERIYNDLAKSHEEYKQRYDQLFQEAQLALSTPLPKPPTMQTAVSDFAKLLQSIVIATGAIASFVNPGNMNQNFAALGKAIQAIQAGNKAAFEQSMKEYTLQLDNVEREVTRRLQALELKRKSIETDERLDTQAKEMMLKFNDYQFKVNSSVLDHVSKLKLLAIKAVPSSTSSKGKSSSPSRQSFSGEITIRTPDGQIIKQPFVIDDPEAAETLRNMPFEQKKEFIESQVLQGKGEVIDFYMPPAQATGKGGSQRYRDVPVTVRTQDGRTYRTFYPVTNDQYQSMMKMSPEARRDYIQQLISSQAGSGLIVDSVDIVTNQLPPLQ